MAEKDQSFILGKQKSENREALNALKGIKEDKILWVSTGSIFIQKKKPEVVSFIEKDQSNIDQEIKDLNTSIKNKTYRIKQLEGQGQDVSGFFLSPLDKKERDSIIGNQSL